MPGVTKYIYLMQRVRKAHQDKVIPDEVTLAFLPGAKIGVVGPNGAGRSTVLKIMAGLETISNGEAALAPGASVGILLQEPVLESANDVLGNVEESVAATRALLARFEELGQRSPRGPDWAARRLLVSVGHVDHLGISRLRTTILSARCKVWWRLGSCDRLSVLPTRSAPIELTEPTQPQPP
jgi:ATPase subunit of ABC transporter with duplicated ATPase domains